MLFLVHRRTSQKQVKTGLPVKSRSFIALPKTQRFNPFNCEFAPLLGWQLISIYT